MGTPDPRHAIRCSACTALVSAGASFCPKCGDPLARAVATPVDLRCAACPDQMMDTFQLQPSSAKPQGWTVRGCSGCGAVWVDKDTLEMMIASAAERGGGEGRVPDVKRRALSVSGKIVYRPCIECGEIMSRRNFARISGVIVDECRLHGSFFDAGELEDVLAFVRSGGMLLSRRRQNEELDREQRRASMRSSLDQRHPLMAERDPMTGLAVDEFDDTPDLGLAFVRWAGRWVRNMFR